MDEIRNPAVASMFYPDDKINLKRMINGYLLNVPDEVDEYFHKNRVDNYLGMIVPHAGYIYSGPVAAYAYSLLKQKSIETIFLLGPSHYTYFNGFSLPYYNAFNTPLGEVPVDTELVNKIVSTGGNIFDFINAAHVKEHSLEVQLPFLQSVLENEFKIVPILMGEQSLVNILKGAEILSQVLKDYEKHYLIVVSSDLSHYHTDKEARLMDQKIISYIEGFQVKEIVDEVKNGHIEACGAGPICVFLEIAKILNKSNIKTLVYKNSGDTSGDYNKVVGYTSIVSW